MTKFTDSGVTLAMNFEAAYSFAALLERVKGFPVLPNVAPTSVTTQCLCPSTSCTALFIVFRSQLFKKAIITRKPFNSLVEPHWLRNQSQFPSFSTCLVLRSNRARWTVPSADTLF